MDLDEQTTETRIADAVLRVIATRGFDVVSVRTVARECALSAGTVQYHFPTRQALLSAGLLRSFDRQRFELLGEHDQPATFAALVATLQRLLPLEESLQEDAIAWVSFVSAAGSRPWLAEIVSDALMHLQQYIVQQISDPDSPLAPLNGLSAEQAARLVTGLLNGLTH